MTTIKTDAIGNLLSFLLDESDRVAVMMRTLMGDDIKAAAEELAQLRYHLAQETTSTTPPASRESVPQSAPIVPEIVQAIRAALGFDVGDDALRAMVREAIKEEVGNLDRAVVVALNDAAEKAMEDVDFEDFARDAVLHAMREVDMDAIAKDVCEETAESAVADHVEDAVSSAAENAVNDADLDAAIAEHLDNNLDADMVKEAVESALVRRKMVLTFGE